jgi:Fuc2NAc and GlcNAc transferase
MNVILPAAVGTAFAAGWALTGAARRYALARRILDTPNERSSHRVPVPLGGGWGIAVPALAAVAAASGLGWIGRHAAIALAGGVAVALVGWIDDRVKLSARVRLLVQVAAACWLVGWLGGFETLDVGTVQLHLGGWGNALAVLAVVWCTNLYNFMDGIDGIAGLEAVCVAGVGGLLLVLGGAPGLALIALVIAAASAGFLVWNRPPARIFMGDAGSGLLGFLLAALALAGEATDAVPALLWVVLLGGFVGDATIVLLRRMRRGERWYSAHRGHLYQRLVQSGWTHARVDRALAAINAVLIVLAVLAWFRPAWIPAALVLGGVTVGGAYISAERYLSPSAPSAEPRS